MFLLQLVLVVKPCVSRVSVEDVDIVSNVLNFFEKFGISKLSAFRFLLLKESFSLNLWFFVSFSLFKDIDNLSFFGDFGIIFLGEVGAVKTGCCHTES